MRGPSSSRSQSVWYLVGKSRGGSVGHRRYHCIDEGAVTCSNTDVSMETHELPVMGDVSPSSILPLYAID